MEQINIRDKIKKLFNEVNKSGNNVKKDIFSIINIDNENLSYLLLNNGNKYYIWIYMSEGNANEARIYLFEENNILNETCITIKKSDINWNINWDINSDKLIGLEKNCYLLEGYLFENEMYFTDVLYPYYKLDYSSRREIIYGIIGGKATPYMVMYRGKDIILGKTLPIIKQEPQEKNLNKTFENLMFANFKYGKQLEEKNLIFEKSILKQNIKTKKIIKKEEMKKIIKGKKIELYEVYNILNGNYEGLLYIKSLKDSKDILVKSEKESGFTLKCKFDETKMKWTKA
jgi:hypothetical protein